MRYNTEHQRNIAFDLLRVHRNDIAFEIYFEKDEPVVIYGLDFLGREIYFCLKEWVNILCFMDRAHDGEFFDGVPVFSMGNQKMDSMFMQWPKVKVLVVILSDWENISKGLLGRFAHAVPVSVYSVFASLKIEKTNFFSHKQKQAVRIVKQILRGEPVDISRIVLVGTSYTELLSFLLFPDWKNSLYIAERFLPAKIVDKMTEHQIPCLYEEDAGEFYDICYLIADYAREKKIPVYGHDHMMLSRPFFENSITVIEDGTGNYDFKYSLRYPYTLDNGETYYPLGYDRQVSKVILTGLMDIPEELEKKAEYIRPDELWKAKNETEKRMIADIFQFPYDELLDLTSHGKDILFLTASFTKDSNLYKKVISEEEQIEMCKEILSEYERDRILIKPHPSDHINYASIMPEYQTINSQFPIQMIKWTNITIKKIIMFCGTTCMNSFDDSYEIEIAEEILFKYGLL